MGNPLTSRNRQDPPPPWGGGTRGSRAARTRAAALALSLGLTLPLGLPAAAQQAGQPQPQLQAQPQPQTQALASAGPGDMAVMPLIGASVKEAGGQMVGAVDDVVMDRDGHVQMLVIGLSGALGVGEKDVAIPFSDMTGATASPEGPERAVSSATGLYAGSSGVTVSIRPDLAALRSAPAFTAGQGQAQAGKPSSSSGVPEGVTKEPKSSTQSGGPG